MKYCSNECREQGATDRRIKWAEKTGYNERQRKQKARQREEEREQKRLEALERKRQSELEVKRKLQEEEERKLFELRTKANEGDPVARMRIAKKFSFDYWEAYRDYEIENNSQFENSKFVRYVNGISVYEDDFPNRVIFTIEEEGKILSELVRNP